MEIKESNKKIKIIIFLLVLLVLAGIFGYGIYAKKEFFFKLVPQQWRGDISPGKETKGTPTGRNITEEFEKCKSDSLGSEMLKTDQSDAYYLAARALIKKDKEICSEIDDFAIRDVCFQYYDRFSLLADKNAGKEVDCGKFQLKDDESMCLAINKNDIKACDSIGSPLLKEICKANTTLNTKFCDDISAPIDSQGACRRIREKGSNEDVNCGTINPEQARQLCHDSLNFIKAVKTNDISICDEINPETGKFDVLFCKVLTAPDPEEEYRNFFAAFVCTERYAIQLAEAENDPAVCEQIPLKEKYNKSLYENCVGQFKK